MKCWQYGNVPKTGTLLWLTQYRIFVAICQIVALLWSSAAVSQFINSYRIFFSFDEVHYASICMLYNQHLFHLDEQPPLFRMILCKTLPDDLFQPGFWSHIGKGGFCLFFFLYVYVLLADSVHSKVVYFSELTPTIANNSRLFPVACAILLSLGMYIFIFILTKSHFSALISGLLVACGKCNINYYISTFALQTKCDCYCRDIAQYVLFIKKNCYPCAENWFESVGNFLKIENQFDVTLCITLCVSPNMHGADSLFWKICWWI